MNTEDTIFALSSGLLPAGIAVIRLSGKSVSLIMANLAGLVPQPRVMTLRPLSDPVTGELLDKALILYMPGPNSATGEDVGEFHCHGSRAVVSKLLQILSEYPETRMAEAGEFSRRAFLNQQMDLVEVEGLADLLLAETEGQRKLAIQHFSGSASAVYEEWRHKIIKLLALIEAAIDFSDETDVVLGLTADFKVRIDELILSFNEALTAGERAQSLRDGVRIVIAGAPNVGKSSLLNMLASRDAAIVSAIAGTTRDVIEVRLDIAGVSVILADTAGLREETDDQIELMGMAKTLQSIEQADFVLLLRDVASMVNEVTTVRPHLNLINKVDLLDKESILLRNNNNTLHISAKTGEGIDQLFERITEFIHSNYRVTDQFVATRVRHQRALRQALQLLEQARSTPFEQLEIIAEQLRLLCVIFGRITGRIDVEDLLDNIFSEFCIGK